MSTIRERNAQWGAMVPLGPERHGDMWTRDGLRDAYFDACYDRHVLLAALDALVGAVRVQHPVASVIGIAGNQLGAWCMGCDNPEEKCWGRAAIDRAQLVIG